MDHSEKTVRKMSAILLAIIDGFLLDDLQRTPSGQFCPQAKNSMRFRVGG